MNHARKQVGRQSCIPIFSLPEAFWPTCLRAWFMVRSLSTMKGYSITAVVDYRWSSAAFHAGEVAGDPLVESNDLLGLLADVRAWLQLMESDDDGNQHERLRQATRTGRPGGNAEFIAHAEQICGHVLTPKQAGRKVKMSAKK